MSLLLLFETVAPPVFDDFRQDIIDGLDSAQSEAAGWDAKRSLIPVTAVVRTSDTVVTITLPALTGYDITAQETITATVPASALVAGGPLLATPTFTVDSVFAGAFTVTVPPGQIALGSFAPTVLTTAQVLITPPVGTLRLSSPWKADTDKITADSSLVTADCGAGVNAPTVLIESIDTRAESVTATADQVAQAVFVAASTEILSVADSHDATVVSGPQVHNVAVNEALTTTGAQTGTANVFAARAEAVTPTDSETGAGVFAATRSEPVTLSDTEEVNADFQAAIDELLASLDSSMGDFPPVGGSLAFDLEGGPVYTADLEGGGVLVGAFAGGPV